LELKEQTKTSNCRILNNCLRLFYTRASTYFCVLALVLTGQFPTSQYVFALLNVYEFLKITCIILSPHGVTLFSEAYISFRRIEEFLLTDFDKPNKLISARDKSKTEPGCILTAQNDLQRRVFGVCLKNVTVRWDSMAYNVLNEASLAVDIGEVVGITGAAGSGKSTLLQVVLKEIDVRKGRVDVGGAVSYASQDAWIFSASIKQNILFGEEMDAEKYRRVIRVCALERDFTLFPFGDNTLVGDRGVMLSGGQKARINLARAVYRNADIYLLDDPLSAVDAHVAGQILEECILGYLRNKCVILVTHQVHFLRHAKTVYLLEMGQLTKLEQDLQFDKSDSPGDNLEELKLYDVPQETKEHRSVGTTRNVYQSYCRASGAWVKTVAIVLLLVVAQVLANVTEFFLAFWINLEQESTFGLGFRDRLTRSTCLYIYTGLTVVFLLVNAISLKVLVRYCMDASKTLHDTMLKKVVYGDMTFFNHHSAGRILNRFAKDIGCIDEYIPLNLLVTVTMILLLIGIILTVCILNYWMVIPTVVILFVMIFFGVIFQPTNKNIKRTEAISKS
jgi:ATP-binding cassette subfamily C (CFTR/MRP) protein 4